MSVIELLDVSKSFDGKLLILDDISLNIKEASSTAVIGNSGTGKSTLLHIAGLLDKPSSGTVLFKGQDTSGFNDKKISALRNKEIGFVFQNHLLLEDYTAIENIMIPAMISGNTKGIKDRATELMKTFGILDRKDHLPSELSGGERQRVAICRALSLRPSIVLADEPTGSLDEDNAKQVESVLLNMVKQEGSSLLLVTHNNAFASGCSEVYKIVSHKLVLQDMAAEG